MRHVTRVSRPRLAGLALILLAASAACSSTSEPERSTLDGLRPLALMADSAGNAPPEAPSEVAPGFFRGTVLGQAVAGSGNDSLATMPRIEGAVVTAYAADLPISSRDDFGEPVASAVTDADGKFALPTMPGGTYVVTIEPPGASAFAGVYVHAQAHAESDEFPWWVILPRR